MAKVVGLGYVGLLAGPALIGGLAHWMPLNIAFILPVVLCAITVVGASVLNARRPSAPAPDRPTDHPGARYRPTAG